MQLPVQVNMAVCDPNALNQIPVESDVKLVDERHTADPETS